ncbi:MAG: hypothetical protein HY923_08325 [Elusimicrobia bacterium]|nr:hypothetical protein [Elusimicrobiota bacterium]
MSRGLRAVFAVLLLAAALPALAGPDDLFDASAANAFKAGQKEFILALENGRYAVRDGRVLDRDKPLTNTQVAALFPAQRGAGSVGPHPGNDDAVARARALNGGKAPGDFDGSVTHAGTLAGPHPAAPTPAPAPVDPGVLQAQLLNRLVFKGTPQEKAAIAEAVEYILKTKTGRELASQYVAERASAEIVMRNIPGSTIVVRDGRKVQSGSGGNTAVHIDPPQVTLNRDYLDTDPDYRKVAMAGTLAHELFGHAFETQRAKKAGQPASVRYYYRGDEIGSELIGWLVETELSGKVVAGDADGYLADPEVYHRNLWSNQPYYVLILSPREMRDPLTALKARRRELVASRAKTISDRAGMREWAPRRDHFVTVHGVSRARFKPADDGIADYEHWASDHLRELVGIETTLEDQIKTWSSPAGQAQLKELKAGGGSEYLRGAEQRLAARRAELIKLLAEAKGRSPAGVAKPVISLPSLIVKKPGDPNSPLDLDDLSKMYTKDVSEHPEHWKK